MDTYYRHSVRFTKHSMLVKSEERKEHYAQVIV